MKALDEIVIDITELDNLIIKAMEMEFHNPACSAGNYWKDRMNLQIRKVLRERKALPYGYVGDGWPIKVSQKNVTDKRGLFYAFAEEDWDTRDVGDAVYQANTILDLVPKNQINICDFGAGYGRLAIPFVYWGKKEHLALMYYMVDYIPESILIAPQVLKQMTGYGGFCEVPAWEVEKLTNIDVFISVHSFQEMTIEAVNYYVQFMNKAKGAIFYSVNLWPENKYVPDSWTLLFDHPFPINRDGSYNERAWRIQ